MPGATTLGLNSAFTLPGGGPAFARQPLPPWTDADRSRPVHEPYQGWVSPFGHLAEGPLTIQRHVEDILCHRYYTCYGSGCDHLTLAAKCWFDDDFNHLYVPSNQVRDYVFRPYRWQEEAVQEAYATVSAGDPNAPTASEIADLADIGKDGEPSPTQAQSDRVAYIHAKWTEKAAAYLAFGSCDSRPFRWTPSLHADEDMAESPDGGYDFTDPEAYNIGKQYEPYENYPDPTPPQAKSTPKSGQGFIAWRKCRNGSLVTDDWEIIANAIANGGTEDENALLLRRSRQACDIIVRKHVTLTRKYWRGAYDEKAHKTIGKEAMKTYDITCAWISGARPESLSGTPYAL
jgi:hypothetical protein